MRVRYRGRLEIVQPKVSFHLNVLKAGFITDRKQGAGYTIVSTASCSIPAALHFDRMPETAVAATGSNGIS
jgi:hypothetical protein